jgi:hypothetical protein
MSCRAPLPVSFQVLTAGAFVMVADSLSLSRELGGTSMQEYSIVQGQTVIEVLFALLSALIASYALCSWRVRAHRASAPESKSAIDLPHVLPPDHTKQSPNPRAGEPCQRNSRSTSIRFWWNSHKSPIRDWFVPILVCSVVVWSILAVAIILLGES